VGKKGLIVGTVAARGSLRVHRADCRFIADGNPARRVKVWWGKATPVRVKPKKAKAKSAPR
jgi:(p)ppGpp synthase/HD superfamily hydrolase